MYDAPPKLWVCDEVIPCFPHIGKQRLDLLVHDAIGDLLDRLTNLWQGKATTIVITQVRFARLSLFSPQQIPPTDTPGRSQKKETHNIVPTPDRERHAMSDEIRIRVQRDVRRRIVAIRVPVDFDHRVSNKPLRSLGTDTRRTDIASDPSPVKEVGNLTSNIRVTSASLCPTEINIQDTMNLEVGDSDRHLG